MILTGDISKFAQAEGTGLEIKLLNWAASSPLFTHPFKVRSYDVSGTEMYRFHAEMNWPGLGYKILGSGDGESKTLAAVKAVAEALERVVVKDLQTKLSPRWFQAEFVSGIETEVRLTNALEAPALPPKALSTTNGWAVHFRAEDAILSAAREALERHILLYSYLRDGWEGFDIRSSGVYEERKLYSLFAKYQFAGLAAGIAALDGRRFPGVVMGYLCDNFESFGNSSRWGHAFFEAIEAAIFFDQAIPVGGWEDRFGYSTLADYQKHYAHEPLPFKPKASNEPIGFTEVATSLTAHLRVLDVSSELGLPVPFYAAQVFGGDVLPLMFSQLVKNEETERYVRASLNRWNLHPALPEFHPVI